MVAPVSTHIIGYIDTPITHFLGKSPIKGEHILPAPSDTHSESFFKNCGTDLTFTFGAIVGSNTLVSLGMLFGATGLASSLVLGSVGGVLGMDLLQYGWEEMIGSAEHTSLIGRYINSNDRNAVCEELLVHCGEQAAFGLIIVGASCLFGLSISAMLASRKTWINQGGKILDWGRKMLARDHKLIGQFIQASEEVVLNQVCGAGNILSIARGHPSRQSIKFSEIKIKAGQLLGKTSLLFGSLALLGEAHASTGNASSLSAAVPLAGLGILSILRGALTPDISFKNIGESLKSGPKKVAIVNATHDFFGEENIRVGPWLTALLNHNPELYITLYTSRDWHYDYPERVEVININSLKTKLPPSTVYDLTVSISSTPREHERMVNTQILNNCAGKPVIQLRSYCLESISDGKRKFEHTDYPSGHDVYQSSRIALDAIGIQHFQGKVIPFDAIPFAGLRSLETRQYWQEHVIAKANSRKIIFFNPFGGQEMKKGFVATGVPISPEYQYPHMIEMMRHWVDAGYCVVVAPNGKQASQTRNWGRKEILEKELPSDLTDSVFILDEPEHLPKGMLNYATWISHLVVTVEGGMYHVAFNMGKPEVVLRMHTWHGNEWTPHTMSWFQLVMSPIAAKQGAIDLLRKLTAVNFWS